LIEEISTIMESPPRDHEAYRSGITISTEAIDSYPWLKEILAEKPTKYNKTAKNSLINEEQHPEATNWMWSRIENNLRNRKA
jgi:hypothetical protein